MISDAQVARCKGILAHYGFFTERMKAIEEMAEAAVELLKVLLALVKLRHSLDRGDKSALAGELADGFVVLTHMALANGIEAEVRAQIEFKIARQETIISSERACASDALDEDQKQFGGGE